MQDFNLKKYTLNEYISVLSGAGLLAVPEQKWNGESDGPGTTDAIVEYLSYDSRDVKPGTLFICKGAHFRESFLEDAVANGAIAYVSEKAYGMEVRPILVRDIRKAIALLADFYYNQAWKRLKLIGITGTKGKSTTAYYVKSIVDHYMKKQGKAPCAIISSIDTDDGVIKMESHITTPEALDLHRHFYNAVKNGREYMVMEVSSQGLRYDRTAGVIYPVAVFLNIGKDHISSIEHKDFEDYFSAKLMLLDQCEKAVINADGDHMDEILSRAKVEVITFSATGHGDITAGNIKTLETGISFIAKGPGFEEEINLAMTGLFNVENALAAIGSCLISGIPMESIVEGLRTATSPGRMELFTGKESGVKVIVDYAHNKMSFESLFESTEKEYPGRKIFAVYGCPGNKAQARRWELSEVAGKHSAKIFITEEDHGEEDLMKISKEIAEHVAKTGCPYEIENDRELAIKKAIEEADENTVILITGKGRETRQKRGVEYIETPSDVDFVLKYLR